MIAGTELTQRAFPFPPVPPNVLSHKTPLNDKAHELHVCPLSFSEEKKKKETERALTAERGLFFSFFVG